MEHANNNVHFTTLIPTIDEALLVSEVLAKTLQNTKVFCETIVIDTNQRPLNLYDDNTEFLFLPEK